MKRNKLFLLLLLSFFATASYAQFSVGVRGGGNISSLLLSKKSPFRKSFHPGFNVGVFGDYAINYQASLISGVYYVNKGVDLRTKKQKNVLSLNYVQIPLHFSFRWDLTDNSQVGITAGGYFAYGVSASQTLTNNKKGENLFAKVYNPIDAGLGMSIFYERGHIQFILGSDIGLMNIAKESLQKPDNDAIIGQSKNLSNYLSVGYRF